MYRKTQWIQIHKKANHTEGETKQDTGKVKQCHTEGETKVHVKNNTIQQVWIQEIQDHTEGDMGRQTKIPGKATIMLTEG